MEPDPSLPSNNQTDPAALDEASSKETLYVAPSSWSANIYLIGGLVLLLLGALLLGWWYMIGGTNQTSTESTKPFVIGGVLPLSGDSASFGIPIQQAADLAVKEINAKGGIGGRTVVVQWQDGKCEHADAQAAAQKLLEGSEIDLMIGGGCSSEFLATAPQAQARRIISLSSSATNPDISRLGRYVFRSAPSDALAGQVAAEYSYNKLNARTAAVITEDKAYTQGLRQVFIPEFEKLGGRVVFDQVFSTGTTDFDKYASEIKALNPDVVYFLPQSPTPGILIVKALKDRGVQSKLVSAEVILIRDAILEQGDILEGVTGIELYFDDQNPKAQELLAAFEAEYGLEATYPGFMAGIYDLLYLIKEAYEATDGSSDAIAEYLYARDPYQGTIGALKFDRNGDPSLPYSIRTIVDHEIPIVDIYTPGQN